MMKISPNFQSAANDYLVFMDKGYPQKTILKLVGDRYQLSGVERSMLYRGIAKSEENVRRREKIHTASLSGNHLFIDTFNQLITIASYLNGSMVFISTDGFLRDASEIHGKLFRKDLLQKSIELIFGFFKVSEPASVEFIIDAQLPRHQMIVESISGFADSAEWACFAKLTDKADSYLIGCNSGLIATSDSQIIDGTDLRVFDLARFTVQHFYHPEFFEVKPLLPHEK